MESRDSTSAGLAGGTREEISEAEGRCLRASALDAVPVSVFEAVDAEDDDCAEEVRGNAANMRNTKSRDFMCPPLCCRALIRFGRKHRESIAGLRGASGEIEGCWS